jgi:phage terminase small subunit
MAEKKLTGKQAAFVEAYIQCNGNATAAAKAAGYKGNNATLRQVGSENLTKPDILRAIKKRWEDREVTTDRVIGQLDAIATGSEDEKNRLRALEIIGKQRFTQKIEHSGKAEFIFEFQTVAKDRDGRLVVVDE